jgi:hypothetical protein
MKSRDAMVRAARGAITVRPLMMPRLRWRRPLEDVGFEISERPSAPLGMESRPPIVKFDVDGDSRWDRVVWCRVSRCRMIVGYVLHSTRDSSNLLKGEHTIGVS